MKLLYSCLLSFLTVTAVKAQDEPKPPVFTISFSNASPKKGDVIEVVFKAAVPNGFHMYSTHNKCDVGPMKLDILFETSGGYQLIGKPYSIGDKHVVDEVFECEVGTFDKEAEIRQKIKITGTDIRIKGSIEGQWCTETTCYNFGGLVPLTFSSTLKAAAKDISVSPEGNLPAGQ